MPMLDSRLQKLNLRDDYFGCVNAETVHGDAVRYLARPYDTQRALLGGVTYDAPQLRAMIAIAKIALTWLEDQREGNQW